jgi:hypothetical protein
VVTDGGTLDLRRVTIAAFTGDSALISSGLSAGELIVTLGVQKLEEGLRVRAVEFAQ